MMAEFDVCPQCGHSLKDHDPATEETQERCRMPYRNGDALDPTYGCGCTNWLGSHVARLPEAANG